jgi:hypothetical protein
MELFDKSKSKPQSGVEAIINREFNLPIESKQLTENPIPEKHEPHYHIEKPGLLQQIDFITFPPYKFAPYGFGYKYLLLVIDVNNRLCDGRPTFSQNSQNIINALNSIYLPNIGDKHVTEFAGKMSEQTRTAVDNHIGTTLVMSEGRLVPWLRKPKTLQGDAKFRGKGHGKGLSTEKFVEWCRLNGIEVKISEPHRSNQNAYIEGINSWFRRQVNQYLLGKSEEIGKKYTNWIECVVKLIQTRNKFIIDGLKGSDVRNTRIPGHIVVNSKTSYLIANGTRVLVHLETPRRLFPKIDKGRKVYKLTNKEDGHTSITYKWSNDEHEVVESVLIPGNPPLYYVRNIRTGKKLNALYPAEQLLILPSS